MSVLELIKARRTGTPTPTPTPAAEPPAETAPARFTPPPVAWAPTDVDPPPVETPTTVTAVVEKKARTPKASPAPTGPTISDVLAAIDAIAAKIQPPAAAPTPAPAAEGSYLSRLVAAEGTIARLVEEVARAYGEIEDLRRGHQGLRETVTAVEGRAERAHEVAKDARSYIEVLDHRIGAVETVIAEATG